VPGELTRQGNPESGNDLITDVGRHRRFVQKKLFFRPSQKAPPKEFLDNEARALFTPHFHKVDRGCSGTEACWTLQVA